MLLIYCDSSFNSTHDHRSITGEIVLSADAAIMWRSKKQSTIADSTTYAETNAVHDASRTAAYLRGLYADLVEPFSQPLVILCDNSAAVLFSKCEQQTSRNGHFHLRLNYIREQVSHEVCVIQYVPTSDNISDLLTKPLPGPTFAKHCRRLGLADLSTVT